MKISAKGRYGLAAMTFLAQNYASGIPVTIVSISEKLGISKIYLEQVFALLKRGKLVNSLKGSQGGYHLERSPQDITAYDILAAIELSLMEVPSSPTQGKVPEFDRIITDKVLLPLDESIKNSLMAVTLEDVVNAIEEQRAAENLMYFI